MLKVGILASTNGTDLPSLFSANIQNVEFSCLITNSENCGAREKAQKFGIKTYYIPSKGKTREKFDREAVATLKENGVELVMLIGFMRIVSPIFVRAFQNAILNVHPSLLPSFAGGMDTDVHGDVIKKGCKVSGATIHFVTEDVDEGPIAMQECVKVDYDETTDSLKQKVQALEQKMLAEAVEIFRDKRFEFTNGIVKIRPK